MDLRTTGLNSLILNSHVINYTTLARSYGLIIMRVRMAAERTPGLLRQPKPYVLQKSLDDFAVTYELNAYTDNPQAMPRLYTALHQNMLDLFNEHGVQIMTPAYQDDPESPKVVPSDQWFAAPAQNPVQPALGSENRYATDPAGT